MILYSKSSKQEASFQLVNTTLWYDKKRREKMRKERRKEKKKRKRKKKKKGKIRNHICHFG
jgi:hypothetical protein